MFIPFLAAPNHHKHCIGTRTMLKSNWELARDISVDLWDFALAIEDSAVASIADDILVPLQLYTDTVLTFVLALFPNYTSTAAVLALFALTATRIAPVLRKHLSGEQS